MNTPSNATTLVECTTVMGEKRLVPAPELIFRPSVYAFIVNDNKMLVLTMKGNGKLTIPGGGIEKGEKIEEALYREVKEEINIDIQIKDFLGFKDNFFFYDPWQEAWHGLLFFYTASTSSANLDLVDIENDAGIETGTEKPRWISINELQPSQFQYPVSTFFKEHFQNQPAQQ